MQAPAPLHLITQSDRWSAHILQYDCATTILPFSTLNRVAAASANEASFVMRSASRTTIRVLTMISWSGLFVR